MANSAATKKPLRKTRNATSSIFRMISSVSFISAQANFAKNYFENFLDRHEADLSPLAGKDDSHALASAPHPSERIVHARVFVDIHGGRKMAGDLVSRFQSRLVNNSFRFEKSGDASLARI